MENIMQVVLNNGLGFASFIALIYIYTNYMTKMEKTLENISETQVQVSTTLSIMQVSLTALQNEINLMKSKKEKE